MFFLTRMAHCPLHVRPLILAYRTELSPWPVLAWAPHVGAAPAWRRGGGRFVTLLRESHMELTAFSEEDFDAKAWVNAACARCAHTPARPLCTYQSLSPSDSQPLRAAAPRRSRWSGTSPSWRSRSSYSQARLSAACSCPMHWYALNDWVLHRLSVCSAQRTCLSL